MTPVVLLAYACGCTHAYFRAPSSRFRFYSLFSGIALDGEELQASYDTRIGILLYTFCLLIAIICGPSSPT